MFGLRLPFRRGLKSEAEVPGHPDSGPGRRLRCRRGLKRCAAAPQSAAGEEADASPEGFSRLGRADVARRSWGGRQPGRRGRVLIATNIGGHGPVSMMESMLAAALAVRDADVEIVLCDGILPGCLRAEHSDLPDPAVLAERKLSETLCPSCFWRGRSMFEPLGLKIHYLSETGDAGRTGGGARARRRDPVRGDRALQAGRAGDRRARVAPARSAISRRAIFPTSHWARRCSGATWRPRSSASAPIAACLPRASSTRRYSTTGSTSRRARSGRSAGRLGVRVVNWFVAYRANSFIFSHDDTYHHTLMTEPTAAWEDMSWGERQRREIDSYLKSRWHGARDWIGFHEKPSEDARRLRQVRGAEPRQADHRPAHQCRLGRPAPLSGERLPEPDRLGARDDRLLLPPPGPAARRPDPPGGDPRHGASPASRWRTRSRSASRCFRRTSSSFRRRATSAPTR